MPLSRTLFDPEVNQTPATAERDARYHSRRRERIRQYELDTLSAEFDFMESSIAASETTEDSIGKLTEISTRVALDHLKKTTLRLARRLGTSGFWRHQQSRASQSAKRLLFPIYVKIRLTRLGETLAGFLRPMVLERRYRQVALREQRLLLARLAAKQPAGDTDTKLQLSKVDSRNLSDVPFDAAIFSKRPTILIDVTPTARYPDVKGGIPRVSRGLAEAAVSTGLALPVYIKDGQLYSYFYHERLCDPIEPNRNDVYVIVDVFWYFMDDYEKALSLVRGKGTRVATFLHDIFPLQYPSLYPAEVPPTYEAGLLKLLRRSTFCLSSSKLGSSEVQNHLKSIDFPSFKRLRFGTFPLGFDPIVCEIGDIRTEILELFLSENVFLSVGTLEPRKGYGVTLDACDLAWAGGEEFSLVIFGRYGWRAKSLQDRILKHREFNRRLFWFKDANDGELAYAFSKCASLVQSSIAEGFGLPVLEALAHGAPVIASDLEVFKEIIGSGITYYEVANSHDLADKLSQCIAHPNRMASLEVSSWADSMKALSACLTVEDRPKSGNKLEFDGAYDECIGFSGADNSVLSSLPSINVACCFDDKMAIQASVVAASVASTTRDAKVNFYMLHPPSISISIAELKAKLETPNFTIVDCIVDKDFGHLHRTEQFSGAIYYRLLLPEIVADRRVIYLDSDILVRKSLLELFTVDLEGTPLAAAVDHALTYHLRDHGMPIIYKEKDVALDDYYLDVLDFDLTNTEYFNTGVLVMDLDVWRRADLAEQCLRYLQLKGELNMADQDAANHIMQGNFKRIDPRWNSFSYLYREYHPLPNQRLAEIYGGYDKNLRNPKGEWEELLKTWAQDPWIVHFSHRSKPWEAHDRRTSYDAEYWENASRTPYELELREVFRRSKTIK